MGSSSGAHRNYGEWRDTSVTATAHKYVAHFSGACMSHILTGVGR